MAASKLASVFIFYAHRDGVQLAQRLQKDLNDKGFDAWLDGQRISGGASWTEEIETALNESEYVLALLTPGSYISEICRAEQLRALRNGKCVIPLLVQRGAEVVPLHLETKNYRDFTTASKYPQAIAKLLQDLDARDGIPLKAEFRQTYITAPPLPVNFVKRPEALASLRDALITDDGGCHIALTALEGMGGIGKTVLAAALCHDEVVQQAFRDGVIWITIGKESTFDVVTRMREVGKALGDDLSRYDNELGAKNVLCIHEFPNWSDTLDEVCSQFCNCKNLGICPSVVSKFRHCMSAMCSNSGAFSILARHTMRRTKGVSMGL